MRTSPAVGVTNGQSTGQTAKKTTNSSLEESFHNVFTLLNNEVYYPSRIYLIYPVYIRILSETGHHSNTALQVLNFLSYKRNSDLILQDIPEEATFTINWKTGSKAFPGKRKLAHNTYTSYILASNMQEKYFLFNLKQFNQLRSSCIKTSNFLKRVSYNRKH